MDGTCSKEHYLYVHCSLPPPIVNMINDIFLEENKVNTSKEPVTVEQVFVEDIPHISNSIASMTYQYRGLNNEKENVNYTIDTERIIKAIDSIGNIT